VGVVRTIGRSGARSGDHTQLRVRSSSDPSTRRNRRRRRPAYRRTATRRFSDEDFWPLRLRQANALGLTVRFDPIPDVA
jgi:hypothetical protein